MTLQTLSEWNGWWNNGCVEEELAGKDRESLAKLHNSLEFREIKLLLGVRRSGKSTLFYQLIDKLIGRGVEPKRIMLVNFEDPELSKKSIAEIFDAYQSGVNPDAKPYLFLDEVHNCPEWAPFVRKLYDLKKVEHVFITDSSSKFIKPEYSSLLTGRSVQVPVFPLSFSEHLSWSNISPGPLQGASGANRAKNALHAYLRFGGFPEVFFKRRAAKKILLNEYFGDIIRKDIVERYNVNYSKIKPLADFLLANSSSPFSPRNYARSFGLSLESLNTYVQLFSEVMLFYPLARFSYSLKTQELSPKKIYACDLGFFGSVGFRFSQNFGRLCENAVFLHLLSQGCELYYWKEKQECDFLIKEGSRVRKAIQACSTLTKENMEREVGGLLEALESLKLKEGVLVNWDVEKEQKIKGKTVKFVPLWKFLLQSQK